MLLCREDVGEALPIFHTLPAVRMGLLAFVAVRIPRPHCGDSQQDLPHRGGFQQDFASFARREARPPSQRRFSASPAGFLPALPAVRPGPPHSGGSGQPASKVLALH